MSTTQPLPAGSVVLMLNDGLLEFESPPPPSGLVLPGHDTLPAACCPGATLNCRLCTTRYFAGFWAQIAYTTKSLLAPLTLLTSARHPRPEGKSELTFTLRLVPVITTPPPSGTVVPGQAAVPCVWPPVAA